MEKHRLPGPPRPHRGSSKKIVQTLSGRSSTEKRLLGDIRALIEAAKNQVARTVDSGLVLLYWTIGKRIEQDIRLSKKENYGQQIVQTLSGKLAAEYGRGFAKSNLLNMYRFPQKFPE